jgi:hypothetical protein
MPNIEIPDIIKSASDAAQDNLPATMQQTDGALSTVVGFFNNVVLYPVKKANLTFRYKLEAFEDDLKEKTKHIPPENLQIPPTMIAGPTLEALRYTYDEAELREMYENLLASAMDNRIVAFAHPSYVDTIKQMSPLDARVLSKISKVGQCPAAKIVLITDKKVTQYIARALPELYVPVISEIDDPFLISQSLINLSRLGVIDIFDSGITSYDYKSLLKNDYILSRKELFDKKESGLKLHLFERGIRINDYGDDFCRVCLTEVHYNAD